MACWSWRWSHRAPDGGIENPAINGACHCLHECTPEIERRFLSSVSLSAGKEQCSLATYEFPLCLSAPESWLVQSHCRTCLTCVDAEVVELS